MIQKHWLYTRKVSDFLLGVRYLLIFCGLIFLLYIAFPDPRVDRLNAPAAFILTVVLYIINCLIRAGLKTIDKKHYDRLTLIEDYIPDDSESAE